MAGARGSPKQRGFRFENGVLIRKPLLLRQAQLQAVRQAPFGRNSAPNSPGNSSTSSSELVPFISSPLPLAPSSLVPHSPNSPQPTPPTPGPPKTKCCHRFLLRGWCQYNAGCRYAHAGWDSAPLGSLEEVMVSYPVSQIPLAVTQRYTSERLSSSLLQSHFSDFTHMIRNLREKNMEAVATGYQLLTSSGIKFNASFLCRMLTLFTSCGQHRFRKVICTNLKIAECQLSPDEYILIFRTLIACKLHSELREMYSSMKSRPSVTLLSSLLRCGKDLGEWVFQLLEDIKLCESQEGSDHGLMNQFLKTVDYQLLIKPTNLRMVVQHLDASQTIATKLNLETFTKLCGALHACQEWGSLLTLFHRSLRLIPSTQDLVCEPFEALVRQLGVSEKLMSVFERLTEEQKGGLSNQAWNKIMMMCVQKERSQRATKFYSVVKKLSKKLSSEVMVSLMELAKKQHNVAFATNILRDGLRRSPPLIPSLPMLIFLASSLETLGTAHDFHLVVVSLLQTKTKPPLVLLEGLLSLCSSERCFSKLAKVVKLARDRAVKLDKKFYERVLPSLREWGQDQEALCEVSQSLEGAEVTTPRKLRSGAVSRGSPSTSVKTALVSKVRPAPPPPSVASVAEATTPSPPTTVAPVDLECPAHTQERPNLNLEEVMASSMPQEDLHELLKLIEFNGKMGQFRAMASVLVDIDTTTNLHNHLLVLSIWEGITNNNKPRKANAFSEFLTHLHHCRHSYDTSLPATPLGSTLLPSDRWLVSQLGIGLLRLCERDKAWQSGFVVLYHLHKFGIHYVELSHPPSPLPPLLPVPPSPCSVALTAVNLCLHMNRETNSALEVMRGCDWVEATNETEHDQRTEVLASLAQQCLDSKMLEDAWQCLDAIDNSGIAKKFVHPITNLHNKLLQGVLNSQDHQYALFVFKAMRKVCLQCLPSVFSGLLQLLCDNGQKPLARSLCADAIANSRYAPLVKKDRFDVTLPLGLIRLELQLLLEECLRRLALEVDNGCTKDLTIHISAGCRDLLEQVLTQDISPPLQLAKVESKLITVSSSSLREWCHTSTAKSAEKESERRPVDFEATVDLKEASAELERPVTNEMKTLTAESDQNCSGVQESDMLELAEAGGVEEKLEETCSDEKLEEACSDESNQKLEEACSVESNQEACSYVQESAERERSGDVERSQTLESNKKMACSELEWCRDVERSLTENSGLAADVGIVESTEEEMEASSDVQESAEPGRSAGLADVQSTEEKEEACSHVQCAANEAVHCKQLLKVQKAAICRVFVDKMKLYYETKFKARDDYTHLLTVLAQDFFKSSQLFAAACQENTGLNEDGKWEVPVAVQQEVKEMLSRLFSKCDVYSSDMDEELGLGTTACPSLALGDSQGFN